MYYPDTDMFLFNGKYIAQYRHSVSAWPWQHKVVGTLKNIRTFTKTNTLSTLQKPGAEGTITNIKWT